MSTVVSIACVPCALGFKNPAMYQLDNFVFNIKYGHNTDSLKTIMEKHRVKICTPKYINMHCVNVKFVK